MSLNINNNIFINPIFNQALNRSKVAFEGNNKKPQKPQLTPAEIEALKAQKMASFTTYESMPDIIKALYPRAGKQPGAAINALNTIFINLENIKNKNNNLYTVVQDILNNKSVAPELVKKCNEMGDEDIKQILNDEEDFCSYKTLVGAGQSPESTKEISDIYKKTKSCAEKSTHTLLPLKSEEEAIKEVSEYFADNKSKVINAIVIGGDDNIRTLLPRNFEQVKCYIEDCNQLALNKEILPQVYNLTHKKGVENGQIIKFLNVAFAYNNTDPEKLKNKLDEFKNDDIKSVMQKLRQDLTKEVYRTVLSPEEFEKLPSSACDRVNMDYLPQLLKVSKEPEFKEIFRSMASGSMDEIINNETNTKTAELFAKNNLDYSKWLNYTDTSDFQFQLSEAEVKKSVLNNVKFDLKHIKKSSTFGPQFFEKLNERGFSTKDIGKMTLDELKQMIECAISTIDDIQCENEFREEKKHFTKRIGEINSFRNGINNNSKITLKMWDRLPENDLLIGGKAQACISLDNKKRSAIADYLNNTMFNFVEIKDQNDTIGFSRIYFVNTDDNKKAMVLDSTELKTGFQGSNMMREKLSEYCQAIAKNISGEDTPIFISGGYCNIPTEDLNKCTKTVKIIGEGAADKKFYINAISDWINVNQPFKTILNEITKIVR